MSYDPQNPFARILAGTQPAIKIFEDVHTLAFMDIMPQADGHVLVIPKEAASTIFDLSEDGAVACIKTTRRIAIAAKKALGTEGVFLMQVNGVAAGQTVPHVHFHIIPRNESVPLRMHACDMEDPAKLRQFAERIIAALGDGAEAPHTSL